MQCLISPQVRFVGLGQGDHRQNSKVGCHLWHQIRGHVCLSFSTPRSMSPNCRGTSFEGPISVPFVAPVLGPPNQAGEKGGLCHCPSISMPSMSAFPERVLSVFRHMFHVPVCKIQAEIASGCFVCCAHVGIGSFASPRHSMSLPAAVTSLVHACQQGSVPCAVTFDDAGPSRDDPSSSAVRGHVLQWDGVLGFISDELEHIQALRAVCRHCATEATAHVLCHVAFHEKSDIMLDPYSDSRAPIWRRCIAVM